MIRKSGVRSAEGTSLLLMTVFPCTVPEEAPIITQKEVDQRPPYPHESRTFRRFVMSTKRIIRHIYIIYYGSISDPRFPYKFFLLIRFCFWVFVPCFSFGSNFWKVLSLCVVPGAWVLYPGDMSEDSFLGSERICLL